MIIMISHLVSVVLLSQCIIEGILYTIIMLPVNWTI